MFMRCLPLGTKRVPHGNSDGEVSLFADSGPFAAYSHSASVGNRAPRHSQNRTASFHDTCTTAWSPRFRSDAKTSLPGPSGSRQYDPFTGNHHSAPNTACV